MAGNDKNAKNRFVGTKDDTSKGKIKTVSGKKSVQNINKALKSK